MIEIFRPQNGDGLNNNRNNIRVCTPKLML